MQIPEITIVIPTLNEKDTIESLILEALDLFSDVPCEIIVVDDHSPDGTGARVEALQKKYPIKLFYKEREGIGAALRLGYNKAEGRYIASIDADKSFETADLRRLYEEAKKGSDLVMGNFHAKESVYDIPDFSTWVRNFFSSNGNRLIRLMTGVRLGTFTSNLRIIRKDVWQKIQTHENSNTMLLEMITQAHARGYKISQIPIAFRVRKYGKSKMRLGAQSVRFLKKLFILSFFKS